MTQEEFNGLAFYDLISMKDNMYVILENKNDTITLEKLFSNENDKLKYCKYKDVKNCQVFKGQCLKKGN